MRSTTAMVAAVAMLALAMMTLTATATREATDHELLHGFYDEAVSMVETEAEASARLRAHYEEVNRVAQHASKDVLVLFDQLRKKIPLPSVVDTVGDAVDEMMAFFKGESGRQARKNDYYPEFSFDSTLRETVKGLRGQKAAVLPPKCKAQATANDPDCARGANINRLLLASRAAERKLPASFFEEEEAAAASAPAPVPVLVETGAGVAEVSPAAEAARAALVEEGAAAAASPYHAAPVYVPVSPFLTFQTHFASGPPPPECSEKGAQYRVVRTTTGSDANLSGQAGSAVRLCVHQYLHKNPADNRENVLVAVGSTDAEARGRCEALAAHGYRVLGADLTPGLTSVFTLVCARAPAASHLHVQAGRSCAHPSLNRALPWTLGTTRDPRLLCVMGRKFNEGHARLARDTYVPELLRTKATQKSGVYELRFKPLVIVHTQTPIWYRKHYHRWYWSPEQASGWMDCGDPIVNSGRFRGRAPTGNHLKLIEELRARQERLEDGPAGGGDLAGLPKWVRTAMTRAPRQGAVYVVDSTRWFVTDIFVRRHGGRWEWSADKLHWMSAGEHIVSGGRWKGEHAVGENMNLLDALFVADGGTPKPQPRDSGLRKGLNELQDGLAKCYAAHKDDIFHPHLSVLGFSGNFGPLLVGLEAVVDLDSRQLGRFAYGGLQYGTSSVNAGLAAYAGMGWKGNSKGLPVAQAYSKWFNAVSVGASTPNIEVGFLGTMAFSSDSRVGEFVATMPVCDAVVTASAGCAVSLDPGPPVSLDFTSTYYVTHDWVNNDCSKFRHWKVCLAFWTLAQSFVMGGPAGITAVLPALIQTALY